MKNSTAALFLITLFAAANATVAFPNNGTGKGTGNRKQGTGQGKKSKIENQKSKIPAASAVFLGRDEKTSGNWFGTYGKEGFMVPVHLGKSAYQAPHITIQRGTGKLSKEPFSLTKEDEDETQFWMVDWNKQWVVADPRLPQRGPGMTERHATVFSVEQPPMITRVDITDKKPHRLSLYVLDYLRKNKAIRVEIRTLGGKVLDARRVEKYAGGVYLRYKVSGSVLIYMTPLAQGMPELSGVFVDPA
jgi:hypothetical protein